MTARIFDNRLSEEWIGFTILRRVIIAVGIVHFSLAAVSGYRAVVQVYSVALETPAVISAGSLVRGRVSTAGRTYVDARIDLEQGQTVEQIGFMRILSNKSFFYDFRPKRVSFDGKVPVDVLTKFKPGRAQLRITAEGHMQWLYIPPPKIQVVAVELR
jgi:hypothetical protein